MRVFVAAGYALLAATTLASFGASAQTVYKCTDKNGNSVFTTDPCGKDAKLVAGTPPKPRQIATEDEPSPAPAAATEAPKRRERTAVDDISDSVVDANCRRAAQNLYREPSSAEVDRLRGEIVTLQNRTWTANSRSLSAQYDVNALAQADQQHIATLQQTIATEELRNDGVRSESRRVVADAIASCDRAKADREKAASQQ